MDALNGTSAGAYIKQAAKELAQGQTFSCQEEFYLWVSDKENFAMIIARASELQADLINKMAVEKVGSAVTTVLSVKVWEKANLRRITEQADTAVARVLGEY